MSTNRQQVLELHEIEPPMPTDKAGSAGSAESNDLVDAWVLTTKPVGATVAGWRISKIDNTDIRILQSSERCAVTSFCYPVGAKMVKAKLFKE